ncbi:hypothetical protein AAG570_000343 [Ranatra chinensis]|uniref:Uncharacterized protein n=1 Tax=Ranatra chinensis TaxID=642074 RepID=A0ABD0YWS7_9HEMI
MFHKNKTQETTKKANLVDEDHKELEQVYMMVMMVKAFLGSLLMFITPIIRIKSFGLAVINTIINIAKFLHEINFFKPLLAVLAPPPSGPAAPSGPSIPDDRWASPDPSTPPNTSYGAPYRRIGTDSYYHHHQHSSYLNEPQTDWSQNSVYQ